MFSAVIVLIATQLLSTSARLFTTCPCSNSSLCNVITTQFDKEVFMFSLNQGHGVSWKSYDWDKLTTLVMVGYNNSEMMCYAHERGKRVIKIANMKGSLLPDSKARSQFVTEELQFVQEHFLDGINVDFEEEISVGDEEKRLGLSLLMQELYSRFKAANLNYQVTYDVGWAPDIDVRFYDYATLAKWTDFLFVMAYDEQSQIRGPCVAGANSVLDWAELGIQKYQSLGILPQKLVLGTPWYGYNYPCMQLFMNNTCTIREVPFRGVNCSDAAGKEINYSFIVHSLLPNSTSGRMWDERAQSPFFNYKTPAGELYQVRYDDPQSLKLKYALASKLRLRGVGVWNADAVDTSHPNDKKIMWDLL